MKSIFFVMVLFLLCCGAATAGAAEMSVAGEKNNVDHDASLIIGSSLPDLVVLTFEPPSGAVNRTFTISNAVRNQGTATAGPFTVWFALSSDTSFTLEDT